MQIELTINGRKCFAEVKATTTLISLLRNQFGLISVREGCGAGECGACTVLIDKEPICACLMPAVQARGREIITIEGLSKNGELTKLQKKFLEKDGVQCGFCTPGMLLTATAFLMKNLNPDRDAIKKAIAGNLCRCTGYVPIVEAIEEAAKDNN